VGIGRLDEGVQSETANPYNSAYARVRMAESNHDAERLARVTQERNPRSQAPGHGPDERLANDATGTGFA
jgi:hypothetical protein